MQQRRHFRGAGGDHARDQPLQQRVEQVRGFWGGALVDALRGEGRACACGGLCPIGVGGAGIAGSAEDHPLGEGAACEFALDGACFAREGVGVVFEDLSERVLDVRREIGCVAHSAWSVPYSGGVLKLMPMGAHRRAPLLPAFNGEGCQPAQRVGAGVERLQRVDRLLHGVLGVGARRVYAKKRGVGRFAVGAVGACGLPICSVGAVSSNRSSAIWNASPNARL